MLPYGLYRLLDEKGQMVGISHPVADDRDNRRILLNLLFAFSVLKATVSPDYPVLRLWYDTLSRGNLQKQEDSNGLSGTRCLVTMVLTVVWLLDPPVYSTDVFSNNEEHPFDESYTMFLADVEYGDVSVRYEEVIEDYLLHADFRRSGDTVLTIISPTGEKTEYDLHIEWDTFEIKKK